MNSFIETLNQYGDSFLSFAWPMLWQSSLLIAALFAFDLLLRCRLRASIRYTLWLVVLVKLCVPPTLALPTSPAWWLHKAPPPVVAKLLPHYTVTYDNGPLPEIPQTSLAAVIPPKPAMTNAAWLLAASVVISSVLLLWLLVRWWQITRLVRCAEASERLAVLMDETRAHAGMKLKVPVKVTPDSMSPAVCGLFRPTILIPQSLAENFSDEQMRAVLLHELIHLRRRDVWVNFVQALLQIVYWWHPLVWLASARIRQVREEAVDDAVMLTLRDEAESYAPTLLEVAKLALNRPLASLGLVGILESRHSLRQRIERLVDFRPPRKAGLTLVSLLGILAFTAVAVPMGDGPDRIAKSNGPDVVVAELQSLTVKVNPDIFFRNLKAQAAKAMQSPTNFWGDILTELLRDEGVDCNPPHGLAFTNATGELTTRNTPEQLEIFRRVVEQLNRADGICELPLANNPLRKSVLIEGRIYPMSDGEFKKFTSGLHRYPGGLSGEEWWSVPPEQFKPLVNRIEASGLKLFQRPRIQTGNGMAATLYVGNGTNSLELACKPLVGEGFVDLAVESTAISGAPVNAFTNHVISKASAEDHGGVVLRMTNYDGYAGSNLVVLVNTEIITNSARFHQRLQAVIKRGSPTNAGEVQNLVQDGKLLYEMGKWDEAEVKLKSALALDPENAEAKYYLGLVQTTRLYLNQNEFKSARKNIVEKLYRIRLPQVGFERLSLAEVVRQLNEMARQNDPEKTGVNIFAATNSVSGQLADINSVVINLPSPLKNARLADVLDSLVEVADKPIEYSILDDGIAFSLHSEILTLYSRHFRVDANKFMAAMRNVPGIKTNNISVMAKDFFKTLGVNLDMPGKSIFFNDGLSELFVRATAQDLDTIENTLEVFNRALPQIHIKARFIEVPKGTLAGLDNVIAVTNPPARSNQVAGFVGILTDKNFRAVLHNLEARSGVETLAEPEVVTTSGRQTQMRATAFTSVVTNMAFQEMRTNLDGMIVSNSIVPQTSRVETGPVLDVVPYVLSDGYTINLTVTPSLTEFLGYDTPPTNAVEHINDAGVHLPVILPRFSIRQVVATLNLWDNQTVVLSGLPEKNYIIGKETVEKSEASRTELVVFITATVVDSAGNRVHAEGALPGYYDDVKPYRSGSFGGTTTQ